jgi:hypothetical protein
MTMEVVAMKMTTILAIVVVALVHAAAAGAVVRMMTVLKMPRRNEQR